MTTRAYLFAIKCFETINLICIALIIKPLVKLILHIHSAKENSRTSSGLSSKIPWFICFYRASCHPVQTKGKWSWRGKLARRPVVKGKNNAKQQLWAWGPTHHPRGHPAETNHACSTHPSLFSTATGQPLGHLSARDINISTIDIKWKCLL